MTHVVDCSFAFLVLMSCNSVFMLCSQGEKGERGPPGYVRANDLPQINIYKTACIYRIRYKTD